MDGNAFLFRVPCPHARHHILSQCLWQVDGQTMFVAKWSPGTKPEKPSLSTVPVWLNLEGVPLQFFNRDALKEIAGLVGHPICLHPTTENLTNIEVARVYTVIDPRKPLPEAVNAQFETGEVVRIKVSCPWLPSLCSHCSKVGHTISRCPAAPPRCEVCRSVKHTTADCTRTTANLDRSKVNTAKRNGKAPIQSQLPFVGSGVSDTGRPKNPSKVLSKTQNAPTKQWQPTKNNSINQHLQGDPAVDNGHKQQASSSHDLTLGDFFVDLCLGTPTTVARSPVSSSSSDTEDQESQRLSDEEDSPDDEGDRFIRVISKRSQKKAKALARIRGPLTL